MTRKWFLGKPLFKEEKKNMKLIRKVHSIPAEGEGLLCISLTNFLLPGLLRSVPSNGTTFLIIFHKSQFKCSALLSRTGIAANEQMLGFSTRLSPDLPHQQWRGSLPRQKHDHNISWLLDLKIKETFSYVNSDALGQPLEGLWCCTARPGEEQSLNPLKARRAAGFLESCRNQWPTSDPQCVPPCPRMLKALGFFSQV